MVKVEVEQVMKQAAVEVEAVAVWRERHPPPKQAGLPTEVAPETEVVEWGSSDGVEAAETEVQVWKWKPVHPRRGERTGLVVRCGWLSSSHHSRTWESDLEAAVRFPRQRRGGEPGSPWLPASY